MILPVGRQPEPEPYLVFCGLWNEVIEWFSDVRRL